VAGTGIRLSKLSAVLNSRRKIEHSVNPVKDKPIISCIPLNIAINNVLILLYVITRKIEAKEEMLWMQQRSLIVDLLRVMAS